LGFPQDHITVLVGFPPERRNVRRRPPGASQARAQSVEEKPGRDEPYALMFANLQKVRVAGYHERRAALDGCGEAARMLERSQPKLA
jgi:hypothetical protein